MKRIFISCAVFSAILFSHYSVSELSSLSDSELHLLHGQINVADVRQTYKQYKKRKQPAAVATLAEPRVSPLDLIGLNANDLELTQGIELDLAIQVSFDFEYIDPDGIGIDGNGIDGSEGSIHLSGVHIGSSDTPLTADQIHSEQPFAESDLALVNNILIDVDPQAGMFITIEELGDKHGNGIDVVVNDIYLGDEFTPDNCRIWDADTREKLDKDRFRKGLGGVIEAYEQVAQRLGLEL
jgi:hypothetical protein